MKTFIPCAIAAFALGGCTISTELDPGGSPKYQRAERGTGSNIARRNDQELAGRGVRNMGLDDVEKLKRTGGSAPGKMMGGG